jgi:hypothetical protein
MTMGMPSRAAQLSTTLVPGVPIIIGGIVCPDNCKTQLDKDLDSVEVFV